LNNQLIHPLTNNKHQQQNRTNNKENNIEQVWRRGERGRNENGGRLRVERGRGAS